MPDELDAHVRFRQDVLTIASPHFEPSPDQTGILMQLCFVHVLSLLFDELCRLAANSSSSAFNEKGSLRKGG